MAQDISTDGGTTRRCPLEHAVGCTVACPESSCAFWEPGGAVLPGRCAFEQLDLSGRPEVAAELLRIRALLDSTASADENRAVRRIVNRLVNKGDED
jgi:hypothetical protein